MTISNVASSYARSAELGNSAWYVGNLFSFLAESADMGGALAIMEITVPQDAVPPPHTHSREDEFFYILEGEGTFTRGDESFDARPARSSGSPRASSTASPCGRRRPRRSCS